MIALNMGSSITQSVTCAIINVRILEQRNQNENEKETEIEGKEKKGDIAEDPDVTLEILYIVKVL